MYWSSGYCVTWTQQWSNWVNKWNIWNYYFSPQFSLGKQVIHPGDQQTLTLHLWLLRNGEIILELRDELSLHQTSHETMGDTWTFHHFLVSISGSGTLVFAGFHCPLGPSKPENVFDSSECQRPVNWTVQFELISLSSGSFTRPHRLIVCLSSVNSLSLNNSPSSLSQLYCNLFKYQFYVALIHTSHFSLDWVHLSLVNEE